MSDSVFNGFLLFLGVLVVGFFVWIIIVIANPDVTLTTKRVIPVRNQAAAAEFVSKQMDALKNMQTRNDDEDYDDFLESANTNALSIYGIDTLGIYQNSSFIPFDNIPAETKSKIKY